MNSTDLVGSHAKAAVEVSVVTEIAARERQVIVAAARKREVFSSAAISDSSHCGRYPVPLGKGRGPATLLSLRTRPVGSFQRWYTVCGMPIQSNRNLVRMPLVLDYCFAIILVKQKPFFKLAQCS